MEVTTIQVDKHIKGELFRLKNRFEHETKKSVSYNDIIKYLLKNNSSIIVRRNLEGFRDLKGILTADVDLEYRTEKQKDLEHEEQWNQD